MRRLNFITPICYTGYGIAGVNTAVALTKLGARVDLFPLGQLTYHNRHDPFIRMMMNNSERFYRLAPCIRLWHQFDMTLFCGKGQHVGWPIFELDRFNEKEKHNLNACDLLFVCSEWAKNVCNSEIPNRQAIVIPLGVDTDIFRPVQTKRRDTIFINAGKWEKRKGHDLLIQCFEKAFTPLDNVQLWMMPTNPFLTPQEAGVFLNRYQHSHLYHKISIIPWQESDEQVAAVMQQADCGIFPSRAEGFNLEALEILACGKHLIITDYSAHKDFCNSQNSLLISIDRTEKAIDNKWFHGDGEWAKFGNLQEEQLVEHMRSIHKRKQEGSLPMFNMPGLETAKKFSWYNTANKILEVLC